MADKFYNQGDESQEKVSKPREAAPEIAKREIAPEKEAAREKIELEARAREEREKLMEEIGKAKLPSEVIAKAAKEAQRLKSMETETEGQIRRLLGLAASEGLSYAVKVAEKTGDAYLIDKFHDRLAENGLYKKFIM